MIMNNAILTPDEAKQARAAIGLSQSKVAQATGISRTNLALFEVKKYLLDDQALTLLKQFYQDAGHSFTDSPTIEQPESPPESPAKQPRSTGIRLMDGYAVPEGFDEEEVEAILAEIQSNDAECEALSEEKSGVTWWSEQPKTEGLNKLLALQARNYVLIRRLQGHELLNGPLLAENTPPEEVTNGMLYRECISE